MKKLFGGSVAALLLALTSSACGSGQQSSLGAESAQAVTCTATGFVKDGINLTAALINPSTLTGATVDATGCNIGVYYDSGTGVIDTTTISGANYFGVLVNGDANDVAVTIQDSLVQNIGESPFNGTQHGAAIYYRSFGTGSASGSVTGTEVKRYQKAGIVANGNSTVTVSNCSVQGLGPVPYIAQNGIQFGWGATGSAMRNTVTGHSYVPTDGHGDGSASAGVLIYGEPSGFTTGIQVTGNTLTENDNGVALVNCGDDSCTTPPSSPTNDKVVNNTISGPSANAYAAGVYDFGNADKIVNNRISGYATQVSTDGSTKPQVHATK